MKFSSLRIKLTVFLLISLGISLQSARCGPKSANSRWNDEQWWKAVSTSPSSGLLTFGSSEPNLRIVEPDAIAASAVWNITPTNGNWVTNPSEVNWSTGAGTFPGSISGTTNTDTATFLTSDTTSIAINVATLNVKSLLFGNGITAPSSFIVGATNGNPLRFSTSGEIAIAGLPNGTTDVVETINAPLILAPPSSSTAGTYGFRNSASTSVTNTLNIAGTVMGGSTSSTITLDLNGTNTGANTVSGIISNGGAAGGLVITKTNGGSWTLSGANTYSGGTTVSAGTLKLSGAGTLGSTSNSLTINGGILNLGGTSQTVGALNGSGGQVTSSTRSSSLTVGNGGGTGSYAGSITNIGSISVAKTGSGTQTLTGSNSYSGSTTVNGGTLKLAGSSTVLTGTSGITVRNEGTLLFAGNNQIKQGTPPPISIGTAGGAGNPAKIDAGGFMQGAGGMPTTPNSGSVGLGSLTLASNSIIDLTNISVLHFSNSSTNTWDGILSIYDWNGSPNGGGTEQILFGGTSTGLNAAQLMQIRFYSDGGTTLLSNSALILADGEIVPGTLAPVPEPSTWAAGILTLAAVAWTQRRRFSRGLKPVTFC